MTRQSFVCIFASCVFSTTPMEDSTNNVCSSQRIAIFIKQQSLKNRDITQFPQLNQFGLAASWEFIFAIYKSE